MGADLGGHKVLIAIAVWLGLALTASLKDVFQHVDAALFFATGAIPMAAFGGAYFGSARFRRWTASLSLRGVTLVEAGRVIGGSGFAVAAYQRLMEPHFAIFTAASDILIGATAVIAANVLLDRAPRLFALWHVAGLLGLFGAVLLGILTSPRIMGVEHGVTSQGITSFPFSLVPTFFGPLTQLAHWIALAHGPARPDHTHIGS
jgi:hypothetical protein